MLFTPNGVKNHSTWCNSAFFPLIIPHPQCIPAAAKTKKKKSKDETGANNRHKQWICWCAQTAGCARNNNRLDVLNLLALDDVAVFNKMTKTIKSLCGEKFSKNNKKKVLENWNNTILKSACSNCSKLVTTEKPFLCVFYLFYRLPFDFAPMLFVCVSEGQQTLSRRVPLVAGILFTLPFFWQRYAQALVERSRSFVPRCVF